MDIKRSRSGSRGFLRLVTGSESLHSGAPGHDRPGNVWPPDLDDAPDAATVDLAAGRDELEHVLELLKQVPDSDLLRVHRLRREVRDGVYRPDLERIADALMEEVLCVHGES